MSIHTILSQMEGELDKQVRPYFTTEYLICSDCKHAYESHYWNGGGSPEASGYDSCLVEGCKCKYAEKTETKTEYDEESINRFKSFFRSFATRIVEEMGKEIKKLRLKHKDYEYHVHIFVHENSGRCGICKMSWKEAERQSIYNQALSDIRTKLQKMKG